MKLYFTPTSPFVRKVRVAAHELGLAARIETVLLRPNPTRADAELSRANPLNKIPALVLDDGSALYDSPVIVEYLGTLAAPGVPALLPGSGPERFRQLRLQALCDGILDAAILTYYERHSRPQELWWPAWLDGQAEKALQGLDALESEAPALAAAHAGGRADLAQLCAGVTLGWLEFRDALGAIRPARPRLFDWYDAFWRRESMAATEPHG